MILETVKMKDLRTAMVFLIWSGLIIYAEAVCKPGKACPSKCSCIFLPSSDNMLVNCSNRGLDQLPTLPSNTEMFVIRNNHLTSLPDNAFEGCSSLLYLDLSSNLLKWVAEKSFAGLEQLQSLLLNNNSVDINTLSASLLQNITQLSRLFIHDNDVSDQVITYNDQMFASLAGLQMLVMDGLPNATFGPGFSGLHSLEFLKVSGHFQYITNNTFKHFNNSTLKTLVVRSGLLTDVGEMAFGYFSHLKTLDLSFNPLLGFRNVSKAWYGMQFTNVSIIYLKRIVSYGNQLTIMDRTFLKELEHTKLKKLFLDSNNIVTIDARFCVHTPYLEHISVAKNLLVQFTLFMVDALGLKKLEILDVSFQAKFFAQADDDITHRMSMGTHMSGGTIDDELNKTLPMTPIRSPRQHKREVHSTQGLINASCSEALNKLVQWFVKTQDTPSEPMYLAIPPKLRVFNGAGCLTVKRDTFHEFTLFGGSHLEVLNYSMNNVKEFWGPLKITDQPQNRITFDLSWNDCHFVHPQFMKQSGSYVSTLHLGRNNLGSQLAVDDNDTFFQYFTELVKLDLSSNNIKSLPGKVFVNQNKLEHLNLRDNSLRLLEFNITHMANLSFIDLSANLLDQLDHSTRSRIDLLANKNKFTVDITDNPLQCSCETLPFLKWVPQTDVHLKDWEKYICMYNGQLTELAQLQDVILPKLTIECQSKAWLIASAAALVSLCFLLAILYVLHRYRFEIQYCCLRLVTQRREYHEMHEMMGQRQQYEYDAFVSFDHQDIPWVNNELIPAVDARDGQGDFNLLLHHRDFEPGKTIFENIYKGIEKSRIVILIVSRHFVRSRWCEEELQMARIHCFEEGKELPLVILLEEELPLLHSSATLRALLRRNTYLKWPEDENERPNFWKSLKKKLAPRRQPRPYV